VSQLDLTGQPAIITGAGSGLGAVIAARLADEGAHVVIGDRDLAAARCAAQRLVNIASVAGTESGAYGSPTYAAAKAGLVRFTTALTGLEKTHHVRVGCIVPGWIGLPRAIAERASMTTEERAAAGPLVPPGRVAGAALDLVHQRSLGQVVELIGDRTRVLH
jgi:NAD(P)-dependent dehydrogenase (short-subunit alcohol dehydrogenase family)